MTVISTTMHEGLCCSGSLPVLTVLHFILHFSHVRYVIIPLCGSLPFLITIGVIFRYFAHFKEKLFSFRVLYIFVSVCLC
jgi:hypothetical protein